MKKIEYQYGWCVTDKFQNVLTDCSSDGWELVSFSVSDNNFTKIHYVFKKEVIFQPYN